MAAIQNLFNLSQAGASDANKPLVSFRAGKCTFNNGTVTPINKKGQVQVLQTPDSLLHFQWKDRTTGTIEDDLIIFPEEAQFQKATPTARVYLLKFTSGRKLFFWLQEPKDDKDKENEEKINQYINNPPPPDQSAGGEDVDMADLQGLAGMNEAQLRQMFQAVGRSNPGPASQSSRTQEPMSQPSSNPPAAAGPNTSTSIAPTASATPAVSTPPATSTPTPAPAASTAPVTTQTQIPTPTPTATPAPTTSPAVSSSTSTQPPATAGRVASGQDKLQDEMAASLSSILAGFGIPQAGQQPTEDVDLQEALLPELVFPLLSGDSEALKELFSHLPAGTQNLAGLRELLFSAQYNQTIDAFSHVMNSGHANSLLAMFGIDPMLAGPVGVIDVNGFITALQASLANKAKK